MKVNKNLKKAYFVAPLFAKKQYGENYKSISKILIKSGFEVWDDVNKVSADDARALTQSEISRYFTEVEKRIRNSDIFVAELSEGSSSVGYEIGYAVANMKPVLILRHQSKNDNMGAPFRANNKLITTMKYDESTLEDCIESFLRKAVKGIFVKRLPIEFTQGQIDYVEFRQSNGIKKSFNSAVREIIEETATKDSSYIAD